MKTENTAYVLYSKFAWDVMVRENRILDQILLYEPFFTQLAWEWLKKRFNTKEYRNIIFYLLDVIKNFKAAFLFFAHALKSVFRTYFNFFLDLFFFHLPFFL